MRAALALFAALVASCGRSPERHNVVPLEFRAEANRRINIKDLKVGQQAYVNLGVCVDLDYHVRIYEDFGAWTDEKRFDKNIERRQDGYYFLLRPGQKVEPSADCNSSTFAKVEVYDDWAERPPVVCPTTCVVRRVDWTGPVKQSDFDPSNVFCIAGKSGEGDGRVVAVDPNDQHVVVVALNDGCGRAAGAATVSGSGNAVNTAPGGTATAIK